MFKNRVLYSKKKPSSEVQQQPKRTNRLKLIGVKRLGKKVTKFAFNKQILSKVVITLLIVVVYRLMSAIPLPGVDMSVYQEYFGKATASEANYLFLIFTGARLDTPSVVGLGLAAYINASIILQLLTPVIPKLEELSKEGERGKQVINQWTRFLTLPLAFMYSIAYLMLISRRDLASTDGTTVSANPVFLIPHEAGSDWPTTQKLIFMAFVLTAGSIFLMWLAEIITEKGLGNGSSIIISIGIIASLPSLLKYDFSSVNFSKIGEQILNANTAVLGDRYFLALLGVLIGLILLVVAIVFINESSRNIDIQYARRIREGQNTANSSLPIKLTLTGVLPIIFASALLSMPQLVVPFLMNVVSKTSGFYDVLTKINTSFLMASGDNVVNSQDTIYNIAFFLLVVVFGMFYAFIVMKPADIAENFQKSGAFIPGIRPGKSTESYVSKVLLRISFAGAVFLGLLGLLPLLARNIIQNAANVNLYILSGIGGTSILIVVSVVLETKRQYDSLKVTRSYERYV